jgi:MYXO-CTERM domain-containing protein
MVVGMRSSLLLIALCTVAISTTARADDSLTVEPMEQQVFGGAEATPCQWPTTVSVSGGGGLCSGALVHPSLVTMAAHCGEGSKTIRFGEDDGIGFSRQGQCVVNPEYLGTSNQAQDWAFCVLDEPVTDLPITPPAYGCETEAIQAGQTVYVVGYGLTGNGPSGTKRWGQTEIVSTLGNTVNIGGQGTGITTCSGDSGGTAYLPMADGSFRAISMVSTGLTGCDETTGVHALMHPAIPWIEETSQIDITPCHDADGTWHPNPNCTGFFAGGPTPSGSWDDDPWCSGTPASGPASTCGDSFEANPDADPPSVTVASPTHGEEFASGTSVTIDIDAIDDGYGVDQVWIEIDGMEQAVHETYPPYSFPNVPFPDGVYTIVAHAVDWAGNEGVSEPITIGINAMVPDDSGGSDAGTDSGGSDSDGSGGTDGGTDSSDPSGGGPNPPDPDQEGGEDNGCGCTSQQDPSALWAQLLLLLPLLLRRRRR